jgi:hypothetical protein
MTRAPLTVTPIPHEPDRYFVQSSSRDLEHTIDMKYQESERDTPRAVCGCEAVQARGQKTCSHIQAVVDWIKENAK